jgi:hypothetical protein
MPYICNMSNTRGAATADPSGAPEFTQMYPVGELTIVCCDHFFSYLGKRYIAYS